MKKARCLTSFSLFFFFLNIAAYSYADTSVSGNITENTIWTEENSPYIITGTLQIWEGITLQINSGVTVKVYPGIQIKAQGGIKAEGTTDKPITFTSTNSSFWGGISYVGVSGVNIIDHCIFENASTAIYFLYCPITTMTYCVFRNNGAVFSAAGGHPGALNLSHNDFINNNSAISGLRNSELIITYNNFIDNETAIGYNYVGVFHVNYNNFIGNTLAFYASGNASADNNWWGTTDTSVIDSLIYDKYDDVSLGVVNYQPIATEPIADAGAGIIFSLSGTVTGAVQADVTITLSDSDSNSTTTDSLGNYVFSGLTNGTYTITPSKSGYTFTPSNWTVTINGANQTGIDFTSALNCTYYISPTNQSFSSSGGTGNVSVTTQSECIWTATSNSSWITVSSGNSGTGNGTVNYSVSANSSTSSRIGTMTEAGQTFTVTQSGLTCTYTISPTSQSYNSDGGIGNVSVTASSSNCSWTATSNDSWITITSGSSGTGNGTVNYSVLANSSTSSRTGTMTIAGGTFTVTQGGGCSTWTDVIDKYNAYVSEQTVWTDVITCYNQYTSSPP